MSEKKQKSTFDKLIMGAIIGAAVGSVIGAAAAPEEGKKTRSKLSKGFFGLANLFSKKVTEIKKDENLQNLASQVKRQSRSLLKSFQDDSEIESNQDDVKKLPVEEHNK